MNDDDFDWYEDTINIEVQEFNPKEKKKPILEKSYDIAVILSIYIGLSCFFLVIIKNTLGFNIKNFLGVNLDIFLNVVMMFFGSFMVISLFLKSIGKILNKINEKFFREYINDIKKLIVIIIWSLCNLYFLESTKYKMDAFFPYARNVMLCILITCISFALGILIMDNFYFYFVERSLHAKISEVEAKEKMIRAMKNYTYELSEISTSGSYDQGCLGLLCYIKSNNSIDSSNSHINLYKAAANGRVNDFFLKKPEIYNLFDAKTLSRDVFTKASKNGVSLKFEDFNEIFPNRKIAFQAFSFFDVDENKEISRKYFRDTIIDFFVERLNLEKNVNIVENFIEILRSIFYILILCVLFLVYLIIFGISLRDLLTFTLSSALFLNFLVSGLATEVYFNIMFIISHPFDVGDDVIIDNIDLKVFKVGLSSTAFLGSNGGRIKLLNSNLWKKNIINMTRAPEKKIIFEFSLDPLNSIDNYKCINKKVFEFLNKHKFDFFDKFSIENVSESSVNIKKIDCRLVLFCRSYKTRSKKFYLRVEFSKFLNEVFDELNVKILN